LISQLIDTNTIVKSSLSVSSTDNNRELSGSFNAKHNKKDESYNEDDDDAEESSTIGRFTDVSVNDNYNFICPSSVPSTTTNNNVVVEPSEFIKRETHDD